MDWHPSTFKPNLKFASELKENLKTIYFEQHEKAKKTVENFSCSLQNVLLEYQKLLNEKVEISVVNEKLLNEKLELAITNEKLLNEKVELSATNEKLRKVLDNEQSNQKVEAITEPPSQILGASPNCKLKLWSKLSLSDKKNNSDDQSSSIIQKENVNDLPPIYSADFDSDIEDGSFITHKSPPVSVASSPVKIQSSPILSKRKKNSSKRSNSSINTSSQSTDSNNDSKISSVNTSSFEKNIEIDLSKEFEKEYENDPLKPIENILVSPLKKNQNIGVPCKILNVSKNNYVKTEFLDKGKKFRQTVLSFKKVAPVMDISKVDLDESLGNQSMSLLRKGNSWSESFYDNTKTNQSSDNILANMKKFNSPRNGLKESKSSNNQTTYAKDDTFYDNSKTKENSGSILANMKKFNSPRNGSIKESKTLFNQNNLAKDDESIEISPVQSERSSKLRNKLTLTKKSIVSNVKEKNNQLTKEKLSVPTLNNNILQQKHSVKNGALDFKYENNINFEANVPQRSISDETYFSQAEMINHKNDMTNFEVDLTEYEDDEMQCDTPPAKKMLLNSFDVIPGRAEETLGYAYKEGPVRKRSERDKLEGWDCRDCYEYYKNLPEKDRKQRQNLCSRHRGKYKPDNPETPPSFWNPEFSESEGDSSLFND